MPSEYTVSKYDDLAGAKLASAGKDRVLAALETGEWAAVLWLEDWLRDEKPLGTLEGARGLYGVHTVEASTDKAWHIKQRPDGDGVWVPKSCAEMYRAHEDGLDRSSSPQAGLEDFVT